jgi:uncharacterized protein YraI
MKHILSKVAFWSSVFATASAFAADGYVTGTVNLRAGPDSSYPSVAMLNAGTPVAINGCVDGWSWCDVSVRDDRGWVAGNFLQEEYQGQRVLISDYGVRIGVPVVSFVFGAYWGEHYRNRSWYGQRERWSRVQPNYQSYRIENDSPRGRSHDERHADERTSGAPGNRAIRAPDSRTYDARYDARTAPPQQVTPSNVRAPQTHANRQAPHPATQNQVAPQAVTQQRPTVHPGAVNRQPVAVAKKAPPAKATPKKKDGKENDDSNKHQH